MTDPDEPDHEVSPTAHLLDEIALYGYRPFSDEADPRPLPDERIAAGAVADMFDALIATLLDTRLEPDLEDLCWALGNLFHRAEGRISRELDDNEDAQKRSQREQDGSEVKSVELERLIREGIGLIERRNAMEFMREAASDQFEAHFRKAWAPRTGSLVNHRTLTAAMIDSRDFLAAKRRSEIEPMLPTGTRIAFTSGPAYQITTASGPCSTRFSPNIQTWYCSTAEIRPAASTSHRFGHEPARSRMSRSGPTGSDLRRRRRFVAMTKCWRRCQRPWSPVRAMVSMPT